MAHPYYHAVSSAHRHGGVPEDYLELHNFFDATKAHLADFRHRALRHHSAGIFEAENTFGPVITNSQGKEIPTRLLGEQHVREDCGYIPTVADWLRHIPAQEWMYRAAGQSKEIAEARDAHVANLLEMKDLREGWAEVPEDTSLDPEEE